MSSIENRYLTAKVLELQKELVRLSAENEALRHEAQYYRDILKKTIRYSQELEDAVRYGRDSGR